MTTGTLVAAVYETPVGDMTVFADAEGTVHAAGMGPMLEVAPQLPSASVGAGWETGEQPLVAAAIEAWLDGDADALSRVPVVLEGSDFMVEVWERLREVPGGAVVSYAELAEMAGRPRASRAVGTACARNRVGFFVPCHRVVQSGGRLGSYGFGGISVKATLLRLEGVEVHGSDETARLVERPGVQAGAR